MGTYSLLDYNEPLFQSADTANIVLNSNKGS